MLTGTWGLLATGANTEGPAHLVSNIRPSFANVSAHLSHDSNMLVAVQQGVLVVSSRSSGGTVGGDLERFKASIGKDDDEALRVLVCGGDDRGLLCNQLGQFWRWLRLCPLRRAAVSDVESLCSQLRWNHSLDEVLEQPCPH